MTDTDFTEKANHIVALAPSTVWNGRFYIEEKLGEGGMAVVYKARHTQLDIIVALKLMNRSVVSAHHSARFMREARVLSALNHKNVVKLQSFGETEDGVHYMALEYAEGPTLEQLLQSEQCLMPSRAVALAIQICAGLQTAHAEGVIHRDLKPSNIIISTTAEQETAKIIDFGIARVSQDLLSGGEQHTLTDTLIGSPCYMSPEQCKGLPSIDARSDIYSLGCILYEMLCGQPPFNDDSYYAVLSAHIGTPVLELPTRHACPESLRVVVLQCLKKEPDARFQNIVSLSKALAEIDWDTMRMVRGYSAKTGTTNKAIVGLCLLSLFLAIIGGLFLFKQWASTNEQDYKLPASIRNSQLTPSTLPDRNHFWSTHTYAPERITYYRNWLAKNTTSPFRAEATFFLARDLTESDEAPQEVANQYKTAATLYAEDMPRIRKDGSVKEIVLAYLNWSSALKSLNDFATARQQLEQTLKDYGSTLTPDSRGNLLKALAEIAIEQQDWNAVDKFSSEMATVLREESDLNVEFIEANLLRAHAAVGRGKRAQALEIVERTLQLTAPRTDLKDLVEINGLVGSFYLQTGLYSRAIKALDLAREIHKSTHRKKASLTLGRGFEGLRQWNNASGTYQRELMKAKSHTVESEQWQPAIALVKLARFKQANVDLNQTIALAFDHCIPKAPSNRGACLAQMLQASSLLSEQRQTVLANLILQRALAMTKCGNEGLLENAPQTVLNLAKALLLNREFKAAASTAERLSSHLKATTPSNGVAQKSELLRNLALSYGGDSDASSNDVFVQSIKDAVKESSPDEYMAEVLTCALISFNNNAPEAASTYWLDLIRKKVSADKTLCSAANQAIEDTILYDVCCGKGNFATKLYKFGKDICKNDIVCTQHLRRRFGDLLLSNGRYKEAAQAFIEACDNEIHSTQNVTDEVELLNISIEACDRADMTNDAARLKKKLTTICN